MPRHSHEVMHCCDEIPLFGVVSASEEDYFATSVMNRQALSYRIKEKRESFMLPDKPGLPDSGAAAEYWDRKVSDSPQVDWAKYEQPV